jgi:hypothetical protein
MINEKAYMVAYEASNAKLRQLEIDYANAQKATYNWRMVAWARKYKAEADSGSGDNKQAA